MFRTPLQHNSGRESYLAGWQLHVPCRQSSKHFHFRSIKSYSVIPLFRYSVFRVLQRPSGYLDTTKKQKTMLITLEGASHTSILQLVTTKERVTPVCIKEHAITTMILYI